MWNPKQDTNELIYKRETDSQKQKTELWLPGVGGGGEMDEGNQKVQTPSYKINKYQGCNVQHHKYN